jgi:ribosomal protein S18 acetylase RimI-like enzyme
MHAPRGDRQVPELEIRPYDDADRDAVIALWREVFPDAPAHNDPARDIERKLSVQRELFFVAALDGALIGTAMAGFDGHRGWVYYLAVSPAHRRRGVGSALMRRAERDLAAFGCGKLNLMVRRSNDAVVDFYRALGYNVEDRISMGRLL